MFRLCLFREGRYLVKEVVKRQMDCVYPIRAYSVSIKDVVAFAHRWNFVVLRRTDGHNGHCDHMHHDGMCMCAIE